MPSIIGTVRLLDVRYTIEDDGSGGSMPVYSEWNGGPVPYADETVQCETVEEAADAILGHGCTANVGGWYADADGSQTVDYSTGEESERTAHLDGFTTRHLDQIDALVREG